MAVATESLLKAETRPPARKRRSFHRRYHKLIWAARILLVAAALVGLPAISHFAYKAFFTAYCFDDTTDDLGNHYQTGVESPLCSGPLVNIQEDMRLDAGAALLGVLFVLSAVGCYRRARRYKPRAPIRPVRRS